MSEVEIYTSPDKQIEIEVQFEGDTVWLTQAQLVALFKSSKANISEHLSNIFKSAELDAGATVRKFRTVRQEGSRKVNRMIEYCNPDAKENYHSIDL